MNFKTLLEYVKSVSISDGASLEIFFFLFSVEETRENYFYFFIKAYSIRDY